RSQHENQSWLAALTLVLDSSALLMTGLEGVPGDQARFTFAIARHALVDLSQIFAGTPVLHDEERLEPGEFGRLEASLGEVGLHFTLGKSAAAKLSELRQAYEPFAHALSHRLLL